MKQEILDSGMDNVDAWRLGQIAKDAGNPERDGVGDLIDRGLMLNRLLNEKGYGLLKLTPWPQSKRNWPRSRREPKLPEIT